MRDVILWHVLVSAHSISKRRRVSASSTIEYLDAVARSPAYIAALGSERHVGLGELADELRKVTIAESGEEERFVMLAFHADVVAQKSTAIGKERLVSHLANSNVVYNNCYDT
jgi:hypothetical protein